MSNVQHRGLNDRFLGEPTSECPSDGAAE